MARGKLLTDRLCRVCGLCCSGALFKDVELQPGDDAEKLAALGLALKRSSSPRPSLHEPSERPDPVGRTVLGEPALALLLGDALAGSAGTPRPTRFMAREQVRHDKHLTSLRVGPASGRLKFTQPCAALQHDGRCRLYADRPRRCRDFDCALLKSVAAGQCGLPSARHTIRTACARANQVRRLLRALGDEDEQLALSLRFKRLHRRLARGRLDPERAAAFSQLTLAVHDLNLLLRESFYA